MRHQPIFYVVLFTLVFQLGCKDRQDIQEADLIIYGGTSAAVVAAVEAADKGKTVILISPDKHLGGLSSGGLGFTDTGDKSVIGGRSRKFYQQVFDHYAQDSAWRWQSRESYGNKGQGTPAMDGKARTMWIFEPHVAEHIFERWIANERIAVYREERLDRSGSGVIKTGQTIQTIRTLSGKTFAGKMFIDATYEGDLMAEAGVSYHVGRESKATYNEQWNGIQLGVLHHKHWFASDISPYRIENVPSSGLLYGVSPEAPGVYGEGDHRIQAYCFRMCLSNHPSGRVPFARPADYDSTRYDLLVRVFDSGWRETFEKFDPIPNRKTDTNNHGPFSTDFIGMNYDYPEASYKERDSIIQDHRSYQQGLMYFLANDPRVPQDVQQEMSQWGLAKDEFVDNEHWPHQLYIREARRMIGEYIMTEHDVLGDLVIDDPIGMGSYTLDAHNAQRYVTPDGFVQNEGDIGVHPKHPYRISYRSIIPKHDECSNLLVPVCLSSSHIAFGSIRMEPVFMILGQSAAAAAVIAIDNNSAVQEIDYATLREDLMNSGQVLDQGE